MLEDPRFSSKISPFISCSSGIAHDFPPFDDVSTCRNVDYKKHLGDSIDVYHLCLTAGEKRFSWHEFSKTMAYIKRVIMIYIPYAPCLVYLLTKLGDFVRALLLGFKLVSLRLLGFKLVSLRRFLVWNMIFPHVLWMSSSQLTNIFFRGVGIPPTSINIKKINKPPIHTNMHIT